VGVVADVLVQISFHPFEMMMMMMMMMMIPSFRGCE
jgi:hypothetical protein